MDPPSGSVKEKSKRIRPWDRMGVPIQIDRFVRDLALKNRMIEPFNE